MLYSVLHPTGPMNHDCALDVPFYTAYKGEVTDLNEAFKLSQNDFSEDYRSHDIRSTSVGDIIRTIDGDYMVMGMGFKKLELDAKWFLDYFQQIEPNKWTVFAQNDSEGRHCALGHCQSTTTLGQSDGNGHATYIGRKLIDLLDEVGGVTWINNGVNTTFKQKTPKERVLAALRTLNV